MTLYRERAHQIALFLFKQGVLPPKGIHIEGMSRAQVNRVLSENHYGWFLRIERGLYVLTPAGRDAAEAFMKAYPELALAMLQTLNADADSVSKL
jgi:hypothetical protein